MIEDFLESLYNLSGRYGGFHLDVSDEIGGGIHSKKDFLSLWYFISERIHHLDLGFSLRNESLRERIFKIDEILDDVRSFFISLNHLIFNILDFLNGVEERSDFHDDVSSVGEGFLGFYKGHLLSENSVSGEENLIINYIEECKKYFLSLSEIPLLNKKILLGIDCSYFRDNYLKFIDSILVYFQSCLAGSIFYISRSMRMANFYMMALVDFIDDFCSFLGSLWSCV
ncbi:hypothetical protein AL01_09375 [Bombella intestini]|uniref:Uncharacterized protein n=1 Tax=Bombella intestini TaxID=1539051 RepID=A0A1S8GN11_9PROT|nr:hypothetical protein [Bombella intestini]OOL17011.1 hypothetical protein AL01_09375 [Bombella intestini]